MTDAEVLHNWNSIPHVSEEVKFYAQVMDMIRADGEVQGNLVLRVKDPDGGWRKLQGGDFVHFNALNGLGIILKAEVSTAATIVTPPTGTFLEWLNSNPLERGSTKEELIRFVNRAPISRKSRIFVLKHLYQLDELYGKKLSPGPSFFRREDFFNVFVRESACNARVIVLSGRRRQGKTCALPLELLHARAEVSGIRDQAVFYHPGSSDVPSKNVQSILLLLGHLRIPTCWDEFTLLPELIGAEYKILLEDARFSLDALSVILFGSSETDVIQKGRPMCSGMVSRGGHKLDLPRPSLGLIIAMFKRRLGDTSPNTWILPESAALFLKRFTIFGYNLAAHMGSGDFPENWEALIQATLQSLTLLHSSKLVAIQRLMANNGHAAGIDNEDLIHLSNALFIRRRGNNEYYDFLDPQLVAYQHRKEMNSCTAEGRVFELMVRDKHLLLQPLIQKICEALPPKFSVESMQAAAQTMLSGNLAKGCELDGIFCVGSSLLVAISCKRHKSQQDWTKSLMYHLKNLSKNSTSKAAKMLSEAAEILSVCVSAIGDATKEIVNKPTSYMEKPIRCLNILMVDLLQLISPSERVESL